MVLPFCISGVRHLHGTGVTPLGCMLSAVVVGPVEMFGLHGHCRLSDLWE